MISSSLEWNKLEDVLKHRARGLTHSRDVLKMIENIRIEVTQLSKAEVVARRGRRCIAEEILTKVNKDIEIVESFLLVATLLG